MRIVLDTSVVVSALRRDRGASNRIMLMAVEGRFVLLATPALFLEYEDVLKRPEQIAVHGISIQELDPVLEDLAALIVPVQVNFQWRPQLHDAKDEMVLEAALNGRANRLVTHNVADFRVATERFGLKIGRPNEFLKEMKR
jgi:putative PIN family toxin of toxin-antitoxin system